MRTGRNRTAFTLVEMLVVMALVAMLSSLLAGVIVMARRFSARVECQEHERQIGQTINQLMMNASGRYPSYVGDNGLPWWANVFAEWQDVGELGKVGPLPSQMQVFHCRMGGALQNFALSDSGTASGGGQTTLDDSGKSWTNDEHVRSWLRITSGGNDGEMRGITGNTATRLTVASAFSVAPGNGTTYEIVNAGALSSSINYGINCDVLRSDGTPYQCVGRTSANYPDLANAPGGVSDKAYDTFSYTGIATPATFILLSEADVQDPNPSHWTGGRITMGAITRDNNDDPPGNAPIVGRHGGSANVLFADMHVEVMEVEGQSWPKRINENTAFWTLPDD